jgi:glycosyltransferase involved in cell wall biosynthesis
MSVSAAFLVKDPPLDRLALLVEYLRPIVTEFVIVVDDRTAAETLDLLSTWRGVTCVPFRWVDDFSEARNAALPHCSGDWILHLDPDELPTAAMLAFIAMVDAQPQEDVDWQGSRYMAPRGYLFFTQSYYDGTQASEWEEHWHCRLFRKGSVWYKPVHEQVMLEGMPESRTRGTPLLPKAPRSAFLIHSRMNDAAKDEQYAALSLVPA